MKARATLVLLLVLSLAIIPLVSQTPARSQSQGSYTERIDIYSVGDNAYTVITMNQLNSTDAGLLAAENSSGVAGFRLMAVSSQNLVSDYQIFGVDGYNLLKLPYIPYEGLFLTVNASSASDASSLVTYFNTLFATNFTSITPDGGTYSYYGSVSFTTVAAPILFRLVPTVYGGFADAYSESQFASFALPSISLVGEMGSSGAFSNTIAIGGASTSDIGTGSVLDFLNAVSQTNTTVSASENATSSEVVVHALDGLVFSTDANSTVSNGNGTSLSGTYTLTATKGKVVDPNVTIDSQVPTLTAYRTTILSPISNTSSTQVLAVTVTLANTAKNDTDQSMVISNATMDDNWFVKYSSVFQPLNQTTLYNSTVASIPGGHNATIVYKLEVTSSAQQEVVIPASTVEYSFTVGNTTMYASATMNEVDLQLNGNPEPAPNIFVLPDYQTLSGTPIGTSVDLWVTVTNAGSAPATDLVVGNQTFQNLPADSSLTPFKITVPYTGLLQRNIDQDLKLQWTNVGGQTETITANSVSLLLSHSSMVIPYLEESGTSSFTASALTSGLLNVTYGFSNAGTGTASPVVASQIFPVGVTCTVISNATSATSTSTSTSSSTTTTTTTTASATTPEATCSGNEATFNFTSIGATSSESVTLELNFTKNDFIVQPAQIVTTYENSTLQTTGAPYVIPGGISLTKAFSPDVVFPGMPTGITVGITNVGTQELYNVTISSVPDSFDGVTAGTSLESTYRTIAPQQSENFSYTATVSSTVSGNLTAALPTATVLLGGLSQSVSVGASTLLVYKPLTADSRITPTSPSDGHTFQVTFIVENDSPVAVSNVSLSWTLPTGVSLVSGATASGNTIKDTFASLAANSSQDLNLTLKANIGLTFDTGTGAHLTYQYEGSTIDGQITSHSVTIREDVTTSYEIPIVLAIVIALAAVFYMRRSAAPIVTSQGAKT